MKPSLGQMHLNQAPRQVLIIQEPAINREHISCMQCADKIHKCKCQNRRWRVFYAERGPRTHIYVGS